MPSKSIIDFCNKLILAPMVRGSLLPIRLLALRHGADLVYSDEIIDYSMLLTTRKINNILGTVDFVNEENSCLLFRTCPTEKQNLVFQIGTANPARAIQVARMVQNDVSAIDINMGCPKPYSTSLGIGAALLTNVDVAKSIVQGLVENIPLPITCKIRISDDIDKTISLVKDFEALGVSAVTVHGRTRHQDRSEPVNIDAIRKVVESVRIPIIANGGSSDIKDLAGVMKFKEDCGATSVMVARSAQTNVSIFRKEGIIPVSRLIVEYLKLCIEYDHPWTNVQYSLSCMLRPLGKISKSPIAKEFSAAESLEQLCDIFGLGEYCREKQSEYKAKGLYSLDVKPAGGKHTPTDIVLAREKICNEKNIINERIHYKRIMFDLNRSPKLVLNEYCVRNKLTSPTYVTERRDRQFFSVITFQEKQYSSVYWHKMAKLAEQAAALVLALHLGLYEEDFLISNLISRWSVVLKLFAMDIFGSIGTTFYTILYMTNAGIKNLFDGPKYGD